MAISQVVDDAKELVSNTSGIKPDYQAIDFNLSAFLIKHIKGSTPQTYLKNLFVELTQYCGNLTRLNY